MKKNKKLLNTFLSLLLACTLAIPSYAYAQDVEDEEENVEEIKNEENIEEETNLLTCGESAFFKIEDNVLTISGIGKVEDASGWMEHKDTLTSIVIEEGITQLCDQAFKDCVSLQDVYLPSSLEYVGSLCFEGCKEDIIFHKLEELDTSTWAPDWLHEEVEEKEESIEEQEEAQEIVEEDGHWHIGDGVSYEDSRFTVHIQGANQIIPGMEKEYSAYLVDETTNKKVVGATYLFEEYSRVVDITKRADNHTTLTVSRDALKNGVEQFYLRCVVSYGDVEEEGWKKVSIDTSHYEIKLDGLTVDENGYYVVQQENPQSFTLKLFHNYDEEVEQEEIKLISPVELQTENVEIYDDKNVLVHSLEWNKTYTLHHTSKEEGRLSLYSQDLYLSQDFPIVSSESTNLLGYSLSLSGNIAIHYYVSLEEDILKDSNATMSFSIGDGNAYTVPVSSGVEMSMQGKTCYMFTYALSAKNMTSNIQTQLVNGKGDIIFENVYSIERYVDYILGHAENFTDQQIYISQALSTYGYYAQRYFGYNANVLPKNILSLSDVDFSPYQYEVCDDNDELEFVGARLLLTSVPGLKLYFKGNADFKVNGEEVESTKEGAYTVITISNIHSMSKMYVVNAQNFELKYGMFSFAYKASLTTNENLKNLMKAMFVYDACFTN